MSITDTRTAVKGGIATLRRCLQRHGCGQAESRNTLRQRSCREPGQRRWDGHKVGFQSDWREPSTERTDAASRKGKRAARRLASTNARGVCENVLKSTKDGPRFPAATKVPRTSTVSDQSRGIRFFPSHCHHDDFACSVPARVQGSLRMARSPVTSPAAGNVAPDRTRTRRRIRWPHR